MAKIIEKVYSTKRIQKTNSIVKRLLIIKACKGYYHGIVKIWHDVEKNYVFLCSAKFYEKDGDMTEHRVKEYFNF